MTERPTLAYLINEQNGINENGELNFLKYIHVVGKKMTRNDKKMSVFES